MSDRRKVKTELPLSNSGRLNAIDELRAVGESRQQGWTLLLVPGGILVWVSRTSPHHAGCDGKQCELLVKKLLQASRANGTGRWVTLVDGAAEFCGILTGSPVSARVIEQTLKDVLNTRR